MTPNGAVDELVDAGVDELEPQPARRAATQATVIATDVIRFDVPTEPDVNIIRKNRINPVGLPGDRSRALGPAETRVDSREPPGSALLG